MASEHRLSSSHGGFSYSILSVNCFCCCPHCFVISLSAPGNFVAFCFWCSYCIHGLLWLVPSFSCAAQPAQLRVSCPVVKIIADASGTGKHSWCRLSLLVCSCFLSFWCWLCLLHKVHLFFVTRVSLTSTISPPQHTGLLQEVLI